MIDLLDAVVSWPTFFVILVVFGFMPGFVIRLAAMIYPKGHPRRTELPAELYAIPRLERPLWVAEQLETVMFEGLPHRVAALRQRKGDGRRRRRLAMATPAVRQGMSPARHAAVRRQYGALQLLLKLLDLRGQIEGQPFVLSQHRSALQRFLDGQVSGRWDDLASLLSQPCQLVAGEGQWAAEPRRYDDLLNEEQRQAVAGALASPHAFVIQGAPGTGRTRVVTAIARQLIARGERVLLVAPTYHSVDSALDIIGDADGVRAVRMTWSADRLRPDLQRFALTVDRLEDRPPELFAANLVCATTSLAGRSPEDIEYDTLIVDDAGRVSEPDFLVAAVRARRWILLGDEHQLPPYLEPDMVSHVHALCALNMVDRGAAPDLVSAVNDLADLWREEDLARSYRIDEAVTLAEALRTSGTWDTAYQPVFDRGALGGAEVERQLIRAMRDHLARSVFERCVPRLRAPLRQMLRIQHRMVEPIAALVDRTIYAGNLVTAPELGTTPKPSVGLPSPVILMDTSTHGDQASDRVVGTGYVNYLECEWVAQACHQIEAELNRPGFRAHLPSWEGWHGVDQV